MDVYQIFYEYYFQNILPFDYGENAVLSDEETQLLSDANIFELLSLMYNEKNIKQNNITDGHKKCPKFSVKIGERKEEKIKNDRMRKNRLKNYVDTIRRRKNSIHRRTEEKIEEMETDSALSSDEEENNTTSSGTITSIATADTDAYRPGVSRPDVSRPLDKKCPSEMKFACDTLFTQFHVRRIRSLAKVLNASVPMKWVKVVASKIKPKKHSGSGFKMLHHYRDKKKQNRHIHIYGTVQEFIKQYNNATDDNIITFSLDNSDEAIHIQHLKKELQKFISITSNKSDTLLLLMASCSIGIPTRKMYTPKQFMTKWKNCKYKVVNNSHIVRTILKGKVEFDRKIDGVEYQQLLDVYNKNKHSFRVDENQNKTPLGYFTTQWYSYPNESDLRDIWSHLTDVKNHCLK